LETFEANTANDFSNSTIPMLSSRDLRSPQLAASAEVPATSKKQKIWPRPWEARAGVVLLLVHRFTAS
jgi:hypothetical protein